MTICLGAWHDESPIGNIRRRDVVSACCSSYAWAERAWLSPDTDAWPGAVKRLAGDQRQNGEDHFNTYHQGQMVRICPSTKRSTMENVGQRRFGSGCRRRRP